MINMSTRIWKPLSLLCFLLGCETPLVGEEIILHKLLRPGRVELNNSGDYDVFLNSIARELDTNIVFSHVAIKRARRDLVNGGNICVTPLSLRLFILHSDIPPTASFISSAPIDFVSTHILTRPGAPIIRSLSDLNGKSIAVWWGVPSARYLSKAGAQIIEVNSEDKAAQLLMAERVDAAWGWMPDSPMHYEKLGHPQPVFDPQLSLLDATVSIVCNKTPDTQAFIDRADLVIEAMRKDGRLKSLLSPLARIVGVDIQTPE